MIPLHRQARREAARRRHQAGTASRWPREKLLEAAAAHLRGDGRGVHKVDELLGIDPGDKRHLFYEEMKRLFYAMREIEPEDVDDESFDRFMAAADQLSSAIRAIEMRRRRREKTAHKLRI